MPFAQHIALYGGSFNPPHMGHQMACLYLLEALGVEEVWLIPTSTHPFGKCLAPFAQRVEMCRLLAEPFGSRVRIDDVEEALGGKGRTYDTLIHLQRLHPGTRFVLAVGSDILSETEQWHRWSDIVAQVPLAVIQRGGFPTADADTNPICLPQVSSSEVRLRLSRGEPVTGLIPKSVEAYIAKQELYREP